MKLKKLELFNNENKKNYKLFVVYIQYIYDFNISLRKKIIGKNYNNYDNLCSKIIMYNIFNLYFRIT